MTEDGGIDEPDGLEAERLRQERLRALLTVRIADIEAASPPAAPRVSAPPPPSLAPPPEPDREPLRDAGDPSADTPTAEEPAQVRSGWGWRPVLAGLVLLSLFVTGIGLTYAGARVIRSSTEGELLRPVQDPQSPGYEALVDATPTMAVFFDPDGADDRDAPLAAITVLTLPSPEDGGGAVVQVPLRTVADVRLFGVSPISVAYDLGSASGMATAVGDLLEAAIGEHAVVDAERWTDLVGTVAPLSFENPDELAVDGEVVFPDGPIELEAGEVATYLAATVEGESDLARLHRHELFWKAWLDAVAAADPATAVPGEVDSGLGRFARTLAAGPVIHETLPVRPVQGEAYGEQGAYVPDRSEVEELVERVIPFPRSPSPGVRSRVRILNGTPDTDQATAIASALPPAGVEVVLIGNAPELDVQTTEIRYFGREHLPEAEAIQEILGVGDVVEETRPSDVVDITVTLGADYE